MFGFKVGVSLSTLSVGGDTEGIHNNTGFVGGGFIRFGFGRFGIQPEVLSVTKGAEIDVDTAEDDLDIRIDYVEVPILLQLPLTYGSSFAPYVFGGPAFAFDVGCEVSVPGVESDVDCEEADVLGEDALARRSLDVGLTAGAGVAFAMGPGAFLLEGRYTWGMTNINDNEGTDQAEVKNRSALFLASYAIQLR
jgi:hypothetical protein